jgi:hypothetical protein
MDIKKQKRGLLWPGLLFVIGAALFAYAVWGLYTLRTTQMPWDYWLELFLENNAQPAVYLTYDSANRIDLLNIASKRHISIAALIGSAFLAGAVVVWMRRYSLRVLLAVIFMCGLAAAAPFSFSTSEVPPGRPLHVQGTIRLGTPLPAAQVKEIQQLLQPENANRILPAELWKQLGMEKKDGVQRVRFTERLTGYGTQVMEMSLILREGLTRSQADTLAAFHWWYVKTLALKAAGPLPKPAQTSDNFEGLWNEHWQSIAEKALQSDGK